MGNEFEPKAAHPTPGSNDLCFIVSSELKDVIEEVRKKDIEIIKGPVKRHGAIGPMESFYFRDPDGNLLEVSTYEKTHNKSL